MTRDTGNRQIDAAIDELRFFVSTRELPSASSGALAGAALAVSSFCFILAGNLWNLLIGAVLFAAVGLYFHWDLRQAGRRLADRQAVLRLVNALILDPEVVRDRYLELPLPWRLLVYGAKPRSFEGWMAFAARNLERLVSPGSTRPPLRWVLSLSLLGLQLVCLVAGLAMPGASISGLASPMAMVLALLGPLLLCSHGLGRVVYASACAMLSALREITGVGESRYASRA